MGIPILGLFWAGYYGHNMEFTWAMTKGHLVGLPHGLGLRMIRAISSYHHLGCIIWVKLVKRLGHYTGAFSGLSHIVSKSELLRPFSDCQDLGCIIWE